MSAVHLPTAQTKARVAAPVPERVDVAIVGAGLGGLMTAARLVRAGRSVALFDGHYVAGGCATMFARGPADRRVAFDIGLHYIGDCGPGGRIPGAGDPLRHLRIVCTVRGWCRTRVRLPGRRAGRGVPSEEPK